MIIRDIKELTPRMQCKVAEFLQECKERGLDCHVFESYRPQSRQDELYSQGRTAPGNIVTWTKSSRHTQREAIDMAFGGEGKWTWEGDWAKMIEIASHYGLESLAPREMAHLQCDGKEYNKNTMTEFEHEYLKISEDEVKMTTVQHNHAKADSVEENIKAIAEIICDRKIKKIIDVLQEALTK